MTESLSFDAEDGGTGPEGPGVRGVPGETGEPMDYGPEALVIRGTVRDSLGVALPRAVVTLSLGGGRQVGKTRSATDGAFAVTAPERGEYLLAAHSPQLGTQSVAVTLDGRPVEVEFRIAVPGAVAE